MISHTAGPGPGWTGGGHAGQISGAVVVKKFVWTVRTGVSANPSFLMCDTKTL